ncbi:MAG TPA: class I SAM-dependent methyltransferase [Candidatus Acidoferrales bacterium]|nr:class I SAM-dependent methyltransferase [Candidatus Acidoferrales bacterium]
MTRRIDYSGGTAVSLRQRKGNPRHTHHPDWNDSYAQDFVPWDTGKPDPLLTSFVESGRVRPGLTLEVGCGTGTNALWLAGRRFDVLGIDVAPLAVDKARAKQGRTMGCRFETMDFLAAPPQGQFDFVFDRGCFHTFDEAEDRTRFAAHVAGLLKPEGMWLSLIGSTEGPAREVGPRRRSALEVVAAIEPVLEIVELRADAFHTRGESPKAWFCLSRQRRMPAQPSTRHD